MELSSWADSKALTLRPRLSHTVGFVPESAPVSEPESVEMGPESVELLSLLPPSEEEQAKSKIEHRSREGFMVCMVISMP
jgi:hypothetical protein